VIHALLVVAVVLFIIWLVFHAAGTLVHLLWLGILIALGIWVFNLLTRRGSAV
jgi:hypothetical protein